MNEKSLKTKMFLENVKNVFEVLKKSGIKQIVICYSGGGDSGEIYTHDVMGNGGVYPSDVLVSLNNTHKDYSDYKYRDHISYITDIRSAVEDLAWIYIHIYHPGFCYSPEPEDMDDDDSGMNYGEVVFDVESATIAHEKKTA